MRSSISLASALLTLASAYTQPQANPTWGALTLPDLTNPVTRGQDFNVTWDPHYGNVNRPVDGVTVSLVLCRGNSNNCALQPTAIVEGIPASRPWYIWSVPCELQPGVQLTDTGNGMLIIVDGTGEFQYSTQFSVLAGTTCP